VKNAALRQAIVGALARSGIQEDVPFRAGEGQLGAPGLTGPKAGPLGPKEGNLGGEEGLLGPEERLLGLPEVVLDEDNVEGVDLGGL